MTETEAAAFHAECERWRLRAIRKWPDTRDQIIDRRRAAAVAADYRPRGKR